MRTSNRKTRRTGLTQALGIALAGGAVVVAAGCESGARTGWLGLNTQLGEPMFTRAEPPGNAVPGCVGLIQELDVPLIRDVAMNWERIQPAADGPCDFTWSDRIVRAVQRPRVDLLVVFAGVPDWACDGVPEVAGEMWVPSRRHEQAFTQFVSRFVERYDGDGKADMPKLAAPVRSYQFMYEMENIHPAEYAWWLKLFHAAVKAADPEAAVVLGGLRSPGVKMVAEPHEGYPEWFEQLLADSQLRGPAYPYFDVAAFHSFPERYPGRSAFDEAVAYMRQTMADHQLTLPIWLTAYGAGSRSKNLGEQADRLVKWTVRARTLGIQRAYLHCLCDARDPGYGLVREEADGRTVKKPAFDAMAKLVREINDRPDVSFRGEGLYVLSGKDSPRYVIWKEESYDPGQLLISGWWSVETVTGPKVVRQGSEIRLNGSPLIIERTTSPFIH